MSSQVGIGSLGGTVFFQAGLCTTLRTMVTFNWTSAGELKIYQSRKLGEIKNKNYKRCTQGNLILCFNETCYFTSNFDF